MHSRKNSVKLFCMCALCGLYPFPVSVSDFTDFFKNRHNSIKLCWNMSKKMPRLNNDEWNQAIAVCQQLLYCSTLDVLERLSSIYRDDCVTGNIADHPRSGRPHVTTAADDRYIILLHLRNRHLTAEESMIFIQTFIHSQKSVETKRSTYSCVPTVLRSNSHLTSSNSKAGLVLPSPALPTCWLGFDFIFRWMSV